MKIKDFIVKLQSLDETHKKFIVFGIVGVLGLIMIIFWMIAAKEKIADIKKEGKLPFLNLVNLDMTKGDKPLTKENTEWKNYKNEKLKISFDYPVDWNVSETVKNDTNYDGNVLNPAGSSGIYESIFISNVDCKTIITQHPGKVASCKEIHNVAIYFYGIIDSPNKEIFYAFDAIYNSINKIIN